MNLGSLRVRLPLVFLAGIILAGVVTTLIAIRLFQDMARDHAVANPIVTDPNAKDAQTIGAIIVASKKIDVSRRVYSLVERLALAGVLGLLVAALLAWYLSRRIVRPILQLSDAADAVASGDYAIDVP